MHDPEGFVIQDATIFPPKEGSKGRAQSLDEAEKIAKECPYITGIRVCEIRQM